MVGAQARAKARAAVVAARAAPEEGAQLACP
jgi:hypothetical protein